MTPSDANDLTGMVPVCCLYHLHGNKHPGCWERIFGTLTHFIDLGTCRPSSGSVSVSRKKNSFSTEGVQRSFVKGFTLGSQERKKKRHLVTRSLNQTQMLGSFGPVGKAPSILTSRLDFTLKLHSQL